MAIALVQTATQVNVAASSTTAPSIVITGTVGGNAITALASIWDNNTTWTLTNTTDGANTFTTRPAIATGGARGRGVVSWAVNITGGDRTVAFNLAGTSGAGNRYYVLGCLEFSGVATSAAEDTFDANDEIDTSGAIDTSAGPITTTATTDVIVGAAINNTNDATLNFASPTSWTNSYRQNAGNSYIGHDSGYWLPGSIQTTYTAQWSHDNNASAIGGGIVVALKSAPAASAASLVQYAFRFFNDDGGEATSTAYAAENVNVSLPLDTNIRVRIGVTHDGSSAPAAAAYVLMAAPVGTGAWFEVADAGLGKVRLSTSAGSPNNIPHGGAGTSRRLSKPSVSPGGDFVTGRIADDESGEINVSIANGQCTELEWCITCPSSVAVNGDVFSFRAARK